MILIVDDEEWVRDTLLAIVGKKTDQCHAVNNGREALEWLSKNPCNLVISDLQMPEINGYELAFRIRDVSKEFPFILSTSTSEYHKEVERLAINQVFNKPPNEDIVLKALEMALDSPQNFESINQTRDKLYYASYETPPEEQNTASSEEGSTEEEDSFFRKLWRKLAA